MEDRSSYPHAPRWIRTVAPVSRHIKEGCRGRNHSRSREFLTAPRDTKRHKSTEKTLNSGHRRSITASHGQYVLPAQSRYTSLTSSFVFVLRPVRIPPPPRAVRLQTCSSERCWRCADPSLDTHRTRKDTDACSDARVALGRRPPESARSDGFLDQVEELLTAPPPTRRRAREFGIEVRRTFGLSAPLPKAARGRRRRRPASPKISFEKFLCPLVSCWHSLGTAGYPF